MPKPTSLDAFGAWEERQDLRYEYDGRSQTDERANRAESQTVMSSASPELFAKVGCLTLCYQTFGRDADPPMLLIMGLGAQMVVWPNGFCDMLAERGLRVIRFDNRDIGRSSRIDAPAPDMSPILRAEPIRTPYHLSDMAADAIGLLSALGLEKAHIVGASMGGMIAQMVAILYPERVLTLTSIMSTTGDSSLPPPAAETLSALMSTTYAPWWLRSPPPTPEEYVEINAHAWEIMRSGLFPEERADERERAERAAARGFDPIGGQRQFGALLASGSRRELLRNVRAPSLVIHGAKDQIVPLVAGEATAAAIPNAKLMVLPEMPHALPRALWGEIADAIAAHAQGAR